MTLKKLGRSFSQFWQSRKFRKSLPSELKNTPLTTGDLASIGEGLSGPYSGTFTLSCGAKIWTRKPDSPTSPMRGVVSCSCFNSGSRGLALTTESEKLVECEKVKALLKIAHHHNQGRTAGVVREIRHRRKWPKLKRLLR